MVLYRVSQVWGTGKRTFSRTTGPQDIPVKKGYKVTGQKVGNIFLDSFWKGNLMSDMYSYDYFDIRIRVYVYIYTHVHSEVYHLAKLQNWMIGRLETTNFLLG